MTTIVCPSCSHPFDARVVIGKARAAAPSAVLEHATSEVEEFLRERTCASLGGKLSATAAYDAYRQWSPAPISTKAFGMGMRANGIAWGRTRRGTTYLGLSLT